jgi:hypothetical protein
MLTNTHVEVSKMRDDLKNTMVLVSQKADDTKALLEKMAVERKKVEEQQAIATVEEAKARAVCRVMTTWTKASIQIHKTSIHVPLPSSAFAHTKPRCHVVSLDVHFPSSLSVCR